jgi:hypothetical protein
MGQYRDTRDVAAIGAPAQDTPKCLQIHDLWIARNCGRWEWKMLCPPFESRMLGV